jgi:hypothetical protein
MRLRSLRVAAPVAGPVAWKGGGERRVKRIVQGGLFRSIGAVLAGVLVIVVLSIGTDVALHAAGVFPASGERMPDALLLLATAYRSVYAIAGSYIAARLAPKWYPLALIATAMPCAWAGGKLHGRQ